MPNRPRATVCLLAVILVAPVSLHAQTPRAYHAEDLGTLGDAPLIGTAINIHGEIAGYRSLPDGTMRAFRWTRSNGPEDLGVNGGTASQALGINDNGDVVGWFQLPDWFRTNGFIAPRGGTMHDLWSVERNILQVNSITNDGQMTGMMASSAEFHGREHAFRTRKDGTLQDLGWVGQSFGIDINNAGDVVGYEYRGFMYAFKFSDAITECRWAPCGKINLGTFGGSTAALSINNAGIVVGWSAPFFVQQTRAFRALPGLPLEDLGTLGGEWAGADAINDAGAIVGWAEGPYPMTAFIYTDADGMIDLNARVPASEGSRVLQRAVAINEVGQILALYEGALGTGTVLLTPIVDTEPPVIASASVSTSVLQPPDGRLIPVTVSVSATDNMDPSPVCAIATVVNSEAPSGTNEDIEFTGGFTVSLRASRLGAGDGRTYTITVRCSDDAGNASTADVLVFVPHDNR